MSNNTLNAALRRLGYFKQEVSVSGLAFARNARGTKVSAEDRQRLLMWELLQDAGVVPAEMPPPPRSKPEQK
jgi:hypothetical protein